MDKQLLKALDNLSVGLEALAEALKDKNAQSGTGQALQAGNFENSLESITVELKSIKKDTQEILKNQQTILALQRKKDSDKKAGEVEEAGGAKKESAIKKGVTTILLIAVAVLAIGLAFKLVGKINFLSVIGLAAAIWITSLAFEKVANLGLTIKQAAITSLVMVIMSAAVTISSYILAKVQKVGIMQLVTAGAILAMFAFASPKLVMTMQALSRMGLMQLAKGILSLPIVMVAVSWGIAKSSKILAGIVPIGFSQAITGILIAGMFTVIAYGLPKLMDAVGKISFWNVLTGKVPKIALVMAAVAIGITEASRYMQRIQPISFSQAMTAILIAGMFTVISYGIKNITEALGGTKWSDILKLPTMLTLISMGVALSAYILFKAKPYFDGIGFITTLRILLLGATIGAIALITAFVLKVLGNTSWKTILQVPTLFTLMATGIAASAFILAKAVSSLDKIGFMTILKIFLLGAAIAVISLIVAFVTKIMGKMSWGTVLKVPAFFTLIATAIAASAFILAKAVSAFDKLNYSTLFKMAIFGIVLAIIVAVFGLVIKLFKMLKIEPKDAVKVGLSIVAIATSLMITSHILNMGNYKKYPNWKWSLNVGASIVVFGLVIKFFKMIGVGLKDAVLGGLVILIIAATVMAASLILNIGTYKKFPTLKWVLGVGAALGAFGLAAILLGTQVMNPFFYAGLGIILLVAGTIIATSLILAQGEYKKYPTIKWLLGVSFTMAAFSGAAILLGFNALNPFFYAGLGILLLVAETIVEVSDILAEGKYNLAGLSKWATSVALLYTVFTPLIITLGAVGVAAAVVAFFGAGNPFDMGRDMLKQIAWSIVEVSWILQKGTYKGGPTKEWAQGVSIALAAFAPVYKMLVDSAIFEAFGMSGVGPDDFARGIKTVARGITAAAWYFAMNKVAFQNGPPIKWAKGVGLAIGAFAPVFVALNENKGWFSSGTEGVDAMVYGIKAITYGIIAAAEIFAANKGDFKKGNYPTKKWGTNVGAAITAFEPVFKAMSEGSGWFTSGEDVVKDMRNGIVQIAYALTDAASAFAGVEPEVWKSHPSAGWAKGVGGAVNGFMDIFDEIESRGYTSVGFTMNSVILSAGVKSMADVARILWKSKKYFSVKLDPNFVKNISKNILDFAKLAYQLDKMLITEKKVTTTDSGIFSSSTSTKTVRERRDLSLVKDVAVQIVKIAKILHGGKNYFGMKIDPYFMRKVGQNMIDFNFIVQKLAEAESNKGFFQRMGEASSSMFGNDPISQIARRMITLAKGYDAMANALLKLGFALKILNIKSLHQLGSITRGLTGQGPMPTEVRSERPRGYGRMYGMDEEGKPIKKEAKKKILSPEESKKNEIFYVSKQLEKMVKLLQSIDRSTSTIDEFIAIQTKNKIMSPPAIIP